MSSNFYSTTKFFPNLFCQIKFLPTKCCFQSFKYIHVFIASLKSASRQCCKSLTNCRHQARHYLLNGHSVGIVPSFFFTVQIPTSQGLHLTFYYDDPVEGHTQGSFFFFFPFRLSSYAGHSIKPAGIGGYILSMDCKQLILKHDIQHIRMRFQLLDKQAVTLPTVPCCLPDCLNKGNLSDSF